MNELKWVTVLIARIFNCRHIRHRNIIMLMAVSFDMDQRQIALVMEPADCTLHYFLYQMVSVVQAIPFNNS